MSQQVPRTNAIRPDVVNAAHLKQEVLLWFPNLGPSNSKVLNGRDRSANVNIESSGKQALPRGGGKDLRVIGYTVPKMTDAIDELTLEQEHVSDA